MRLNDWLIVILGAILLAAVPTHSAAAQYRNALSSSGPVADNRAGSIDDERPQPGEERTVRTAILEYLQSRFESRLIGATTSVVQNVDLPTHVAPVEGTAVAVAFDRWQTDIAKTVGGWTDYRLRPRFSDVLVESDRARATVTLDVDYHYATEPSVDSSFYDVVYQFELRKDDTWLIVGIDQDDDAYQRFKDDVAEVSVPGRSVSDAALQLVEERSRDLQLLSQEMESMTNVVAELAPADADLARPVESLSGSFSYKASNGAEYARRFGSSGTPGSWFYTATNNDCTNFVSQSVWAAYGGYVPGKDSSSKQNIANKVRMVPNVWQAGTGGGTPNWESVDRFWNYAVSSKSAGPKATGYNNNATYGKLSATSIRVGDVLQLRRSSRTDKPYEHSVYVSLVLQGPPNKGQTYWDLIYVSYHSSNHSSMKLSDLIASFGGTACNLRRLAFSTATFAK